jgi:hypothetical protein
MVQENAHISDLAAGQTTAEIIQKGVAADKIPLASVFAGLSSKLPRVKFGCSKTLLLISEKHPELLRGSIETIAELLDSNNRILKWNAIAILGNLASVDADGQIRSRLKKLYSFLAGGELITANTAIAALGKIAYAFPEERKRIVAQLLGVEGQSFETEECRNIAIGKTILALDMFCDPANPGKPVRDFVSRQTSNSRRATANKAKAFMAKHGRTY